MLQGRVGAGGRAQVRREQFERLVRARGAEPRQVALERREPARAEEALDEVRDGDVVVLRAEPPRERDRGAGQRRGDRVGHAGVRVPEVGGVAAEQLVAALAGQHHRDVTRGQPRERPGGQHARVAERLVHGRGPGVERLLALARRHHQFVVLGADGLGDAARERRLVVAAVLDAHAERGEGPAVGARGQRRDQPRVHAAREEDAEGHLAGHARGHRGGERRARALRRLPGPRARAAEQGVPRAPVAAQPLDAGAQHERVRGRQLADPRPGRVRAGERAVHEVARERGRRGIARDPRQREQRAGLRGEREPAGRVRDEQRLLAGAVARQRQRAARAVPQRDREHAVQRGREILAALLEEVRQHGRVGAVGHLVPAPAQGQQQLVVVVDLAVHHARHVAGLAGEHARRLVRRHDREPRDAERAGAAVPHRLAGGPAVAQPVHHLADEREPLVRREVGRDDAGDAAHARVAPGSGQRAASRRKAAKREFSNSGSPQRARPSARARAGRTTASVAGAASAERWNRHRPRASSESR